MNSWDFNYWGFFDIVAILLLALIAANVLKKYIKFLRESLIPTSVLGGLFLLIISTIYKAITKQNIFETSFFGPAEPEALELEPRNMHFKNKFWSSWRGSAVTNPNSIHEDTGSIPGLTRWVKDLVLP